jgi:hypothetical protein
MAARKFIQKAIKHPGALRATAKRMGLVKGNNPLGATVIGKLEHSKNATTRRRAHLAETLSHMRKALT